MLSLNFNEKVHVNLYFLFYFIIILYRLAPSIISELNKYKKPCKSQSQQFSTSKFKISLI
jgi:hypothetical protein